MKILFPLIILICSIQAAATTFTVTRADDRNANCISGSDCSLREAVKAANAQSGADIINFAATFPGTVNLTEGELFIAESLTINGGSSRITINRSGGAPFRIFKIVPASNVFLNNLIISGGLISIADTNGGDGGGGIFNQGNLELFNSVVKNNGLAEAQECCGVDVRGGGIYNGGSLSVRNSEITENTLRGAKTSGGGIFNEANATLAINDSVVSGNKASANTTGLQNSGCGCGGGIYNIGTATINKTLVKDNSATGRRGNGGGLYSLTALSITNSAIVGNKTQGFQELSYGAGIFANGTFLLSNSTVSGNAPDTDFSPTSQFMSGGGLAASGNARIEHSTIAFNSAGGQAGGIYGNPSLYNTIISDNTAATNADVQGFIDSRGYNIIGDTTGNTGWTATDLLNRKPNLAPLADNGGATLTHALLSGSPAINAGNNAGAPPADQRGFVRIVGGTIDIGAYESPTTCFFAITQNVSQIPVTGGNGSFNIAAVSGCSWTVSSNVDWITVSPASGAGNATVNFTVAPNSGGARTGQLTVGGQSITISQSGCTYALSPANASLVLANGGLFVYNVNTQPGCQWTSVSNAPWLSIVSGSNGSGSGFVAYSVAVNLRETRTGTITTGGQTFSVTQNGFCTSQLSPASVNISGAGGSGIFSVSTESTGCSWTAVSSAPWIRVNTPNGSDGGAVSFTVSANSGVARTGTITAGGQTFTINQAARMIPFDFDGDGKADISIYRDGTWWYAASSAGEQHRAIQFGAPTDKTVPGDFDGDGKNDTAVFRDGFWHVLKSSDNLYFGTQFGQTGDLPSTGDFDGDGRTDIAVYRPGDGYWYILQSRDGFRAARFGETADKPVAADFDGDGITDIAVYRPSNGTWYILQSNEGFKAVQWGDAGDIPVVGDYDGDFKADTAVFRPSEGIWYVIGSRDGFHAVQFGQNGDKVVPADYDGDGKTDYAVFRDGTWYLLNSAAGFRMISFGYATDKPLPNSFITGN